MNTQQLHAKLIAAARANPPSDAVPYAFEKRIMARLTARAEADPIAFWGHMLWRAVAPCVAVVLLIGVWSYFGGSGNAFDDPSAEFETTVLAGLNQIGGGR